MEVQRGSKGDAGTFKRVQKRGVKGVQALLKGRVRSSHPFIKLLSTPLVTVFLNECFKLDAIDI